MPHILTGMLQSLQYQVSRYQQDPKTPGGPLFFTKSGVYIPALASRQPPIYIGELTKDIGDEIGKLETFEEFAQAIESVASLVFMTSPPRGNYLFGGNFLIPIPAPPMLQITQAMIDSAIARHAKREDKNAVLDEGGTCVQLEKVISSEEQLSLWARGYSIHRAHAVAWVVDEQDRVVDISDGRECVPEGGLGGECCPDFSCCSGHPGFSMEERQIFLQASGETRFKMLGGALQQAFIDLGKEESVHIVGMPHDQTLQ
jgi:hypothetical protein